ncbi:MAG: phosphate ABC transporter substrate-binding/OmpA family protein [Candidatus Entotheonellia bacterium]
MRRSQQLWVASVALAVLALLKTSITAADAAEVTLQIKGGDFQVTGELKSFDNTKYLIEVKSLGTISLDATRVECVGGDCPKGPFQAVGSLGTTTWMGDTVIGTEFVPRLIHSYANSIGAIVTRVTTADLRNLEFKLSDKSGREVGQINVQGQGVAPAFAALLKNEIDAVFADRPVAEEEAQQFLKAGLPDLRSPGSEHVWGLDSMMVLVSRENSAVSLSLDSIAQIFAGQITDWSQVGLPPGKINVYAPTQELGTWNQFESMVMKPRNLTLTADAKRSGRATDWSDFVAEDPQGISINTMAYIRDVKALNIESSCGLITRPSAFASKTEEYPMTHRMYFYTAGQSRNPLTRALVAHALSRAIQPVLKEANFVDQEPELLGFDAQTSRIAYALNAPTEDFNLATMRNLINDLKAASRLSITFRFQSSSYALDNKALADVGRLRDLLATPEYKGKTIMLIGFADSVGRFDANMKLSERRAQAVQRALAPAGQAAATLAAPVATKAYGELAPVACNDSPGGQQLNRRVEVWIKH